MEEKSLQKTSEEIKWQWFTIDFDINKLYGNAWFIPTFNAVVRKYAVYPNKEIKIRIPDKPMRTHHTYEYKFIFDWQDEEICGIEVYRRFIG